MERKHKITIPEPCHENWDEMTPNENGRFCMSCSKTVIDFTTMLPQEIQHFFIQNQNKKICGRFKKSQLDSITIQIPSQVLYTQTHYHKIFLLALFIAMGTTLFSCADKDGNKQKIDSVEIIENTSITIPNAKNEISKNNPDQAVDSVPKADGVKFQKPVKTKFKTITVKSEPSISCALPAASYPGRIITEENNSIQNITEDDIIYMGAAVETAPNYPGGINSFYDFFVKEFKTPEEAENFKSPITVSFVIDKDGSLSSFDIPKNANPQIGKEIIRVLKLSPKWIPGEQNRKRTRTKYSLPIAFE
jgi:hypothetical protein